MDTQTLTQKIVIRRGHIEFKKLDDLCRNSKRFYNFALYEMRQHFFDTNGGVLKEKDLYHIIKNKVDNEGNYPYYFLPTAASQQVIRNLIENWKSFKALQKKFILDPKSLPAPPSIPKYRKGNHHVVRFDTRAFSKNLGKKTITILKQKYNISIKVPVNIRKHINTIKFVRVVPKYNHFVVELIYDRRVDNYRPNNGKAIAIDLGIDNFATIVDNTNKYNPFIVNGKIIKSINQRFNKKLAKLKSRLPKKVYTSKAIRKLYDKRDRQLNDQLHKISKTLINYCIYNNINTIVLGYNIGWKQHVSLGKVNNQKFVGIPYYKFKNMLIYKCEQYGLNFKAVNEAYTSKTSSIDEEPVCRHSVYKGKRVTRGVFKSSNGIMINADVNAAYNILRQANFTLDVISTKVNKLSFTNPGKTCNPSKMGYSGCDPTSINFTEISTASNSKFGAVLLHQI